MAKSKMKSSRKGFGPVEGKGHMFGKQAAGPKSPGNTAGEKSAGGKWAVGGKGHMFGFTGSQTAKPGCTAK